MTEIKKWSHSGVAVLADGTVVVSTPGDSSLSFIHADGSVATIACGSGVYHGIARDLERTSSHLWLADIGVTADQGKLLSFNLDTSELVDISPNLEKLPSVKGWRPTAVACEKSLENNDGFALWVADGYGNSLVHRISANGEILTLDGLASGKKFDCPHGIALDTRGENEYVVVADRNNKRLVWFDLTGNYIRELTNSKITSPSSIAIYQDFLVVTELFGGLIGIDAHDFVFDILPRSHRLRDGAWPNVGDSKKPERPNLQRGKVNSPHGVTVSDSGQVVFTEWLIGGRVIALDKILLD